MKIRTETLAPFIGGQLEIINPKDEYIYRGEIKTAEVSVDNTLTIKFKWMARGINFTPKRWVNETTHMTYKVSLNIFSMRKFILGKKDKNKIMSMVSKSNSLNDTLIFSLPGGKGLNPEKVEGLNMNELSLVR